MLSTVEAFLRFFSRIVITPVCCALVLTVGQDSCPTSQSGNRISPSQSCTTSATCFPIVRQQAGAEHTGTAAHTFAGVQAVVPWC